MVIFHSYVNHANMNANAPGLIHSTKCLQDEMWVWQSLRPKHLDAIITQLTADHCHRLCISRMMTHTQNQCKTCKNLRRTRVQIQNMSGSKCKEHGMYLGSFDAGAHIPKRKYKFDGPWVFFYIRCHNRNSWMILFGDVCFFNWLKIGKIGKIWLIILSSFSPLDLPEIAGLTQHFPISQDVLVHIAHTDLSGETVWCLLPHGLPDKCPVVSRWEATYPPSSGPTWKGISEFYRVGPPNI